MRYGTTVQVIQTANNLPNPNAIYAGQMLTIP
jgi:LysM repeat protein